MALFSIHIDKLVIEVTAADPDAIREILKAVNINQKTLQKMANELDTLTTEVSETKTVIDSAVVLIKGLKDKLDAAGTDPAKLAALSASLDDSQNALSAAIAANTPAEPSTDEPVVTEPAPVTDEPAA